MLTRTIRRLAYNSIKPSLSFGKASKKQKKETLSPDLQTSKEELSNKHSEQAPPEPENTVSQQAPKQQIKIEKSKNPDPRRRVDKDEFQSEDEPLHSNNNNRNTIGWWIYRFFFWGTSSLLAYNTYLVYNHRKKTPVEDQPTAIPFFIEPAKWLVSNFNDMVEFITQPPSKKLLYDPVHPDLHPKTLVLNLTGTVLQSEYIFGKGIKTTLRPGLQNMLKRLSQKYEIIIFAEEDEMTIMNKVMKIDPRQMHIRGVLGRESMVWKGGEFVKDLKYLNRDLKKVIAVDRIPQNVKNQPQNTIILSQFKGDKEDNELLKLTYLLEKLVDVPDVRKYLASLGDSPVETYYNKVKQVQQKMNKKASIFGFVGGKPQKKDS